MRDVLVTFMYVLLAGGRLRALLGDADSPALFVHHHHTKVNAPLHWDCTTNMLALHAMLDHYYYIIALQQSSA